MNKNNSHKSPGHINKINPLFPSILSADFSCLGKELEMLEKCGIKGVHIDVMDGAFVPNITIGPCVIKSIKEVSSLFFDVHLMIENPAFYAQHFIDAGADCLTIHAEAGRHAIRTLKMIKSKNIMAGISINPETPAQALEHIIEHADLILVMTVNPGFGGQSFMPLYNKIKKIRQMADSYDSAKIIQVDGGVTPENAESLFKSGVNWIVAGSAVFKGDPKKNIEKFENIIKKL
jgi:ribulose-phosphate 3-epimerase